MNEAHLRLCASPEWAVFVEQELLPWALGEFDLGTDVLEVGAGPGLTTDVLRRRVARLTAVEVDEALATSLAARLEGTNVDVVHADGTALPFEESRFDTATCFTMLHHVPSVEAQDRLLAEGRTARPPACWPICMRATPMYRSTRPPWPPGLKRWASTAWWWRKVKVVCASSAAAAADRVAVSERWRCRRQPG